MSVLTPELVEQYRRLNGAVGVERDRDVRRPAAQRRVRRRPAALPLSGAAAGDRPRRHRAHPLFRAAAGRSQLSRPHRLVELHRQRAGAAHRRRAGRRRAPGPRRVRRRRPRGHPARRSAAWLTRPTGRSGISRTSQRIGFQFFASGVAVSHAFAHIVDFGQPVDVGGLTVSTGDILFGDCGGLLSVPPSIVAEIPAAAERIRIKEEQVDRVLSIGRVLDRRPARAREGPRMTRMTAMCVVAALLPVAGGRRGVLAAARRGRTATERADGVGGEDRARRPVPDADAGGRVPAVSGDRGAREGRRLREDDQRRRRRSVSGRPAARRARDPRTAGRHGHRRGVGGAQPGGSEPRAGGSRARRVGARGRASRLDAAGRA